MGIHGYIKCVMKKLGLCGWEGHFLQVNSFNYFKYLGLFLQVFVIQ